MIASIFFLNEHTWKLPLLRTKGMEHMTMVVKIQIRAIPVGLAQPLMRPKTPGFGVKIHSA